VRRINAAVDAIELHADPRVVVLDLAGDFTPADGTLKTPLYSDGHLHLGPEGYELRAARLRPAIDSLLRN